MSGTDTAPNSDDIVDIGEGHHKAGRLQEAETFYRQALAIDPGHPGALYYLATIACDDGRLSFATELAEELLRGEPNDAEAWHLLGVIALKEENSARAIDCLQKALAIQPANFQSHYCLGAAFTKQDILGKALASFQRAATLNPAFAETHISMGNIFKTQGRFEEAIASFQQAIHIKPNTEWAYASIGEILLSQERSDDAIAIFHKAITANVGSAQIYAGLGTGYLAKKQYPDAIASFERAIALDPRCFMAQFNLGNALFKQGNFREATTYFRQALALNSQDPRLLENLGTALYSLGEIDNAAEVYRQWAAQEPNNPVARHHLAACTREAVPPRAEDAYVEHTFDTFAETFDSTLAGINYRGPQLLAEALQRHCGVARKQFAILDAGCGTGLGGPLVKDYAVQLKGVDLSAGMLSKAKLLNVYDELIKEELTTYLQAQNKTFDIILSADTLIYFGAVESLFSASRMAMRDGGYMFLTAEALISNGINDKSDPTYRLNPHGRYSHSEAYLRRTLSDAGFTIVAFETAILRYEHSHPVQGFIVSCRAVAVDAEKISAPGITAQSALRNESGNAETWHVTGVTAHNEGKLPKAIECFNKALAIDPAHVPSHYCLGVIFSQQSNLDEALTSFQRAAVLNPAFAEAYCSIGSIFKIQNKLDAALSSFQKAVSIKPDFEWAYAAIGEILLSEKRSDEAIENFRKALSNNIINAQMYAGLGTAYYAKMQYIEAMTNFEFAIALDPKNYISLSNLGYVLKIGGKYNEAESFFQRALALNPRDTHLLEKFADTLYLLERFDVAAELYRQWLVLEPNNPIPRHHLAGCGGEEVPARAEDAYVENTFDDFAKDFDSVLEKLGYRAPQLLEEVMRRQCGTANKQFVVLDAGCGTGLCGPYLSDYSTQLIGVDLSGGMLEKAKLRNLYDELIKAELTEYLQSQTNAFDVILSADTLVYFGELESVLKASRSAIRTGGHLFFTVESLTDSDNDDQSKPGYKINPHGRYSHSEPYLRRMLGEADFAIVAIEAAILRNENKRPVHGFVVSCRTA